MKLVLGVVNVAYAGKDATTTGEVAEHLENKYHIMRVFFEVKEEKIAQIVSEALVGSFKTLSQGGTIKGVQVNKIDRLFRHFLEANEMGRILPHQVVAAGMGVSHRFKDAMNRQGQRGARPAFIDTGLYSASFRAWLE